MNAALQSPQAEVSWRIMLRDRVRPVKVVDVRFGIARRSAAEAAGKSVGKEQTHERAGVR
jgi:hypothetical protein